MNAATLLADYRAGRTDPSAVAEHVLTACATRPSSGASPWITKVHDEVLLGAARRLDTGDRSLPLYGVPFAVKDNIDVAGLPTTAGLASPIHTATESATVVRRLLQAGAMLVGKTNMDQLATGLVGTRSPYGACCCVADPGRISGGSSSGSAVAVAAGLVAFALGTDTAGSGRVPAAFNGLLGLKPTRGLISTRGVLPACASLDCVSVFAHDAADAATVFGVAAGHDPGDPWSRSTSAPPAAPRRGRVGVPRPDLLSFTEPAARTAWQAALDLAAMRFELVEVDIAPLLDAAPLLYDAWVAERTADLLPLIDGASGLDPTVEAIIRAGADLTATDVFRAAHRLAVLRQRAAGIWASCDALLVPTVSGHPTFAQVAADPVGVNGELGRYTNFVNLLDLCAVAAPGPARRDGLPSGVTFLAPAFHDARVLELAMSFGGAKPDAVRVPRPGTVRLAVVGAHMSGLPLNAQLTEHGARMLGASRSAPAYRLYALPGDGPVPRPGLIRTPNGGAAIDLEVWELSPAALGELLGLIPAPLALGRVELEDHSSITGFVCEGFAADGARDVTAYGGWRAYLAAEHG
jgi:allophanate hydrolase